MSQPPIQPSRDHVIANPAATTPDRDVRAPDPSFFNAANQELDNKGFLVTSTEELFQWGAHRQPVVDDLRARLLRG